MSSGRLTTLKPPTVPPRGRTPGGGSPAAVAMRPRLSNAQRGLLALCFVVVVYLVLAPLVIMVVATFKARGVLPTEPGLTFDNYINVFLSARTYELLGNTITFSLGALALGATLAITFAWLLERTDLKGRNLLFAMIVAPMAMPGMLAAMAWIFLLDDRIGVANVALRTVIPGLSGETGPLRIYSLGGMIFIEGIRMVPTLFLMISGAFRAMDPALEEASRVSGSTTLETARRITLPLMWPAILAALLYYSIVVIESFEVPGIVGMSAGIHVFSTAIYRAVHPVTGGLPDYGMASTLGLVLVLIAVVAIFFYQRATKNASSFVTVTGKAYRPQRLALNRWRWPAISLFGLYFGVALVMPLAILTWRSVNLYFAPPSWAALGNMTGENYSRLFANPQTMAMLRNTLIVAVLTATGTMIIAMAAGWFTARKRSRSVRVLDLLTFVPHAVASIVLALGVMLVYLAFPNPIYGTVYIIVIAGLARYLAYTVRLMNSGIMQLDPALEEVSQVSGAGWLTTYRRILLPLLIPIIVNGWIWVAIHAGRELSAALMLYHPNSIVVSTQIWSLWDGGASGVASALGVVLIVVLIGLTWLGRMVVSRKARL